MDKAELKSRLEFRKSALQKLREAYLELVSGNAKSYALPDRQLTRLDLPQEIEKTEKQVDELTALLAGGSGRRAFGVLPRDW